MDRVFAACDQGQTFPIKASDYDQSCEEDADCIGIGEGDGCDCRVDCQNAAINVADQAKWRADLERTPMFASMTLCNCPAEWQPRCVERRCETGGPTSSP